MEPYYVYILRSQKHQRFYTGISSNPDKRLESHNLGLNKSTKAGIPWQRTWLSVTMEKSDAMILERKIKKRGAARFLNDLRFN